MLGVCTVRTILFIIAILLSIGLCCLAIAFFTGRVSALLYTILSTGISIALIFALFHFIYLYLAKGKSRTIK